MKESLSFALSSEKAYFFAKFEKVALDFAPTTDITRRRHADFAVSFFGRKNSGQKMRRSAPDGGHAPHAAAKGGRRGLRV